MGTKRQPWLLRALLYASLVVLALVLTGCAGVSTDVVIDFYHGESWRAVIEFVAPVSDTPGVESQLSRLLIRAEECGAYSSYSRMESEGNVVYTVEIAGSGLECLHQAVFEDQGEISAYGVGDQRQIYLSLPLDPTSQLESLTITLRGKEILEGDGEWIDAQTMTWHSRSDQDGWIYAVLTEQSGFGLADAVVVVDFYSGGIWRATMEFTTPTELLARTMGVDEFERELEQWVVQTSAYGVYYPPWQRTDGTDSLVYTVEMAGSELEALRQAVFGGQDAIAFYGIGDQREVHFNLPATWMSEFNSVTITVSGSEILRGNGELTDKRAITWYSWLVEDDWIYAVLTERSGFSLADAGIVVDLYTGDKWEANMKLTVPTDVLARTVGVDAFEGELQEWIDHAHTCGVYPSRHRIDGVDTLTYLVEVEGSGLNTLSCTVFSGGVLVYTSQIDKRQVINFSQDDGSWWGFDSLELTLRGGEVIESNGWSVDYRTVTWQDPAGMTWAVLTERSRFFGPVRDILNESRAKGGLLAFVVDALPVAIGLLLVAALVFLGIRSWQHIRSQRPTDCTECGFHIPEDAQYCPECGQKREGTARWLFRRCYERGETLLRKVTDLWIAFLKSRSPQSAASVPHRSVGGVGPRGMLLEQAGGTICRSLLLPSEGRFVLGSDPASDLCLDDPGVSARHVAICAARTCYFLEDLGSQRGIYLNDELIRSGKRLKDGDVIRLGHTSLVFTTDTLL